MNGHLGLTAAILVDVVCENVVACVIHRYLQLVEQIVKVKLYKLPVVKDNLVW